jgi:hypothetical protein
MALMMVANLGFRARLFELSVSVGWLGDTHGGYSASTFRSSSILAGIFFFSALSALLIIATFSLAIISSVSLHLQHFSLSAYGRHCRFSSLAARIPHYYVL